MNCDRRGLSVRTLSHQFQHAFFRHRVNPDDSDIFTRMSRDKLIQCTNNSAFVRTTEESTALPRRGLELTLVGVFHRYLAATIDHIAHLSCNASVG